MKTSVLMSTYNGKDFIETQMDSIRQQLRTPDEVIFVDDKSTDNTTEIITDYIKKYKLESSWFLHINQINKGWERNFMESIPLTHGDIVFFSDQDDFWLKEKIEKYCDIFEKDTCVDVLISQYIKWNGEKINSMSVKNTYHRMFLNGSIKHFNVEGLGCTLAFRRTFYESVKGYYIINWAHDDFLRKMAQFEGRLGVLDNASILRRIHGNNASLRKRTFETSYRKFSQILQNIDSMRSYVQGLENLHAHEKDLELLDKVERGYKSRIDYFTSGNIKYLIKAVITNPKQYTRLRQILGDYLLVKRH